MAKPTPVMFIGTKPTRPHFICDEVRFEHWEGHAGLVPVLRLRNDQFGCMTTLSHESLSNLHAALGKALERMETGAAVEAKGLLDSIVQAAKSQPKKPEEGESNA
ncbi:MAG: hypothetical protein ACJ75S_07110 [Solirubrobacterales bacterium]|jgi:hypothetical protein